MADVINIVPEASNLGDNNVVYYGEYYGVFTSEQEHAREELITVLQKHLPAYKVASIFINKYLGYAGPHRLVMVSGPYAGERVHAEPPTPPPSNSDHFGSKVSSTFLAYGSYEVGRLIMVWGLPTIDKQTQLVYIEPSNGQLNIGTITKPARRTITIKNSAIVGQTLEFLDIPDSFGLTFLDFVPNTYLAPSDVVSFEVEIGVGGQTVVSSNFYIQTSIGRLSFTLIVLRINLLLLNMEPNSGSYTEQYTYSTKVFTSMTKKEARKPLIDVPRRSVNYSVNIYSYEEYTYAKSMAVLSMTSPARVYQPLWLRGTKLDVTIFGSTSLLCDTVGRDFKVGEQVVVQNSATRNVNLVEIVSISTTSLQVKDPVTADKGADILPAFLGYASKSSSGTYKNGKIHSHSYKVEELNQDG